MCAKALKVPRRPEFDAINGCCLRTLWRALRPQSDQRALDSSRRHRSQTGSRRMELVGVAAVLQPPKVCGVCGREDAGFSGFWPSVGNADVSEQRCGRNCGPAAPGPRVVIRSGL